MFWRVGNTFYSNMVAFLLALWIAVAALVQADYWLGSIPHQGASAFNPDKSYKVFRNVRDFGARGDGVTDDTNAINAAINAGSRCGAGCDSTTTTPALVYFPSGTYVVSSPLLQYYYTFMVGDANQLPILKASPSFSGMAVIDADVYLPGGINWFTNQNNFFREIKNFRIDLTAAPNAVGVHWQVSQATSLQNIFFDMVPGGAQQGLFMENGSGGFLSNLTFTGGKVGMVVGNQQFTTRDLVFNNCNTAVQMLWDWGWVFKGLRINGGSVGIDMASVGTAGNAGTQQVGSVILLDSTMSGVGVGVKTYFGAQSGPGPAGSLRVDNVNFVNTPVAIGSATGATLLSGNQLVSAWTQGSVYAGGSLKRMQGPIAPLLKPLSLLSGTSIFERNQPLYQDVSANNVLTAKSHGAKGDGITDDTAALQALFRLASSSNLIFLDHGAYVVTNTITVPAGARITGEVFSIIMASGAKFKNAAAPLPVFRVGNVGETGSVEISNIIFEVMGPLPGAILVEWNIKASSSGAAAIWNVHGRVGGTAGSQLQQDKCTKGTTDTNTCSGPFMMFHSTPTSGFYMENCWWWTADHELDMAGHNQISLFTGRGLWVESQDAVWLYGTASEHNQLYNYQFTNTTAVFASMFQVETPYFQGVPNALTPFAPSTKYKDPNFSTCSASDAACKKTWGLRFYHSNNVLVYGAGLYSFYDNYSQDCYATQSCQNNVVSIESSTVTLIGVNTVGVTNMVNVESSPVVAASALSSIPGNNGIKLLSTLAFMQVSRYSSLPSSFVASPPAPSSNAPSPSSAVAPSPTITAGATNISLPCILTSVVGDAVYCVSGPACGGAGASPASTLCPRVNSVAVQGCAPGIPSYQNGKCVLPRDAQCTMMSSGAWGCSL
ncbi:pectate lyase superfamily protein-domain-containing protein [Chytriomyces sp. MP71]|nr:pectate lyase superfamily protein-domain-containing protein [Chytriomyces sp. MP71]